MLPANGVRVYLALGATDMVLMKFAAGKRGCYENTYFVQAYSDQTAQIRFGRRKILWSFFRVADQETSLGPDAMKKFNRAMGFRQT